jgi:Na+-translocating ferredoxin:NAD+ oxidoreductase RnfC subunit
MERLMREQADLSTYREPETIEELTSIVKEAGIVGAGGAGFPTWRKLDKRAQTLLLNCAECEPLLCLHRQLLRYHAEEILSAFHRLAVILGAKEAVICLKAEYQDTLQALKAHLSAYPLLSLHLLPGAYPMGDEVVLVYEATGKVIPPGSLPIEMGVAVFNVETIYNLHNALTKHTSVTHKLITVTGDVAKPATLSMPIGASLEEAALAAGGSTISDPVYLVGGPMMGRIGTPSESVTKTTNGILLLPASHPLITSRRTSPAIAMKRAASACCQCRMCTDLCPRHALGHPIRPHRFMQAASNHNFQDMDAFTNLFFCSGCGLCESFSCPQGLAPRSLIAVCKSELKKAGINPPKDISASPVSPLREYRTVWENRLEARLGLSAYPSQAPLTERNQEVSRVRIPLSQHIGAPALPIVSVGDRVTAGDKIGEAAQGLSVPIHASLTGLVTWVGKQWIEITAERR